jgi:hypothetical protein
MPVAGSNVVAGADALQAMIEKVRPNLEKYFESTNRLAKLIGKANVETISDKLYRIPFLKYIGGTFQKFDADNGVLGYGSGLNIDKLTAGYVYTSYGCTISKRAMDTTATPGQAIVNVFSYQLSNAMAEMGVMDDVVLHGSGDGELTNSGSATGSWSGGTTYTFNAGGDTLGVNRLREGMAVEVFDTTGATKRVNGTNAGYPFIIDHIDWDNRIVYLNATVTGAVSSDILVFTDQSSSGQRQTAQSGWPLSGDTFRHGIYYANDNTGAHYYLGQLRSNVPQLNPSYVSGTSSSWTHNHTLQMRDKLIQRRDESVLMGMFGVVHMAQRAQAFSIGIAISNWFRGKKDEMIDLMPENIGYEQAFEFAGFTHYISKRQYRDRIDYINPKLWGRAQLHDTKFHEEHGQGPIFPTRSSSGQLKAGWEFFVVQAFDFVCFDPGGEAYMNSFNVPSGY